MKKILALAAFTLIAALYFGSCDLLAEKYTPRERMEAFIEDANNGRWLDLKQHTHPEADRYNTMPPSNWSDEFGGVHSPIGSLSVSGTTAIFEAADNPEYTATLQEDDKDNYKIRRIERISPTSFPVFE